MEEQKEPRVVRWPTDDETKAAFEAYTLAVGKVSYAWNYLHEKLGQLFVVVNGAEREVALAIWYSTDSDRTQRNMLKAANAGSSKNRWPLAPQAKDEIAWLLDRAESLADARNNAVHAPATLLVGPWSEGNAVMGAAFMAGHARAKKLVGKDLLAEFAWCERYAEALTMFTQKVQTAICFAERYPWPERPSLPTRDHP